ncbi:DJ-1/PfpI family protein [bacterium]|nr:DJ-1/PfpI family protein [bacterium]
MKRVLLLLAKGFEPLEAAVFTDVLGWSSEEGDEQFEILSAGLHQEVKASWGLTILPDIILGIPEALPKKLANEFDAVAVPGGFEEHGYYIDAHDQVFSDVLAAFNNSRKIIASVCVGALPLGKAGILNGRKATTYHLDNGERRNQLSEMGATIQNDLIVVDKNLITSSCPSTALDVAFTLLGLLTDAQNVEKVKKAMGF